MKYDKPATEVENQITTLIHRGLACTDPERAARHMRAIGYYRLSAYWLPFEEPPLAEQARSRRFRAGATWDEVINVYAFDRQLRLLVMEAIERVEVAVRASWVNRLTLACGSHAHLDPERFTDPFAHVRFLGRLADAVAASEEVFVKHYRAKYDHPYTPPLWAACELLSLGQLSMLYASTRDQRVRQQTAKDVGLPSKEVLASVLQVIALTRNICAHHGRLWNRRFVKRLPVIKRFKDEIVLEPRGQAEPQNLIYNTLVVLLQMPRHQGGDATYRNALRTHLEVATSAQRSAMGFPEDWRARGSWSAA